MSGEFVAGDFIELSVGFDNGETADMDVPVVAADDEYTGLDNGTGVPRRPPSRPPSPPG